MAITYPLALASFYDALEGWSTKFELVTYQSLTGLANGEVIAAQRATPKWGGDVIFKRQHNRASVGIEALIASLKGSVGSFKAYDMRRAYPLNDALGSKLTNGSVLALGDISASGVVSSATYTYEGSTVTIGQATTLTRASTGTYVDVSGVIQTAAIDALRFDYSTGAKMMLVEAAGTNLLIQSEDMNLCFASRSNTNVSANTANGPDGLTLLDKFIPTAVSSTHFGDRLNIAAVTNTVKCFSVYVRAAEYSRFGIYIYDNVTANHISGLFNLSTLTATAGGGGTSTARAAGLVDCGGGLYRAWISGIPAAADSGNLYASRFIILDASGATTFTGDAVGGIHAGYAQLEGAAAPSSYIPTTTAAVTRSADVLTFQGLGTNDWTLTFDDNTTQSYANDVDDLVITASALTRPNIKSWSAIRDTQPAASAVKIKSVGSNNKSLALKWLPPFYQLAVGDYVSFVYSTTLVALHQVLEAATADYLGDTAEFEVTPFIRTGAAADNVVTLIKPYGMFRVVPGSYAPPTSGGPTSGGGGFKMIQVLK